ncbi:MAG: FIST C-terminal domain-containing protein [Frankiaceae bacterium]|nr:FIST C-terminal domain-containing protein [Frankiaceae bacterium]MBV9369434.1 FIST C-terminal domain-containing protein [Frankiales bacterium]
MARFGAGLAEDADLLVAAEAAARQALAPLAGRTPDLALVFVCGADDDAVGAAGARAGALTGAHSVVGCSAPGVIGGGTAVEAASAVAVWCAVLPDVHVRAFHLEVMPSAEGMAVVGLPERQPDDAVAVLLADPWSFPIDGFVERSNDSLAGLPFVGGLASGLHGRGSTRLFLDGDALDRGAVGVLLGGPVGVRTVVSQGCRPIGPEMTVTAADGNVLLELAGVSAVAKLEAMLADLEPADQALASSGLDIGIAIDEYADDHGQGDFLVRGIAGVDESTGGLIVGDLVPVGRTVQFQLRDAAAAATDLHSALSRFRDGNSLDTVEGALLISCNGRGGALFPDPAHDLHAVQNSLGTTDIAGFFAAGEIAPVGGRNHVHGFTAAVLAFGSGANADRGTRIAT